MMMIYRCFRYIDPPLVVILLLIIINALCAEYLNERLRNTDNTFHANVTGNPALTINVGFSSCKPHLPVGMMMIGRRFDDGLVLRLAHAYEQLRDADDKYASMNKHLHDVMKSQLKC